MRKIIAPYHGDLFHGTSFKNALQIRRQKLIRASRDGFVYFSADPGTAALYKLYRDEHNGRGVTLCFAAANVDPSKVSRDPVHEQCQRAYRHKGDMAITALWTLR